MNSPKWDWSHTLSHRQKLPPQLPLTYLRPLWSLTRRHLRHSRYFLYLPAQTSPIQTDHHPAWRYPLTVAPALLQPPRIVFGCCPGDRGRVDAYDKNNNPLLIRATKSQQLVEVCHTPLECASYLGEEKSREIYDRSFCVALRGQVCCFWVHVYDLCCWILSETKQSRSSKVMNSLSGVWHWGDVSGVTWE